MIEEKWLVDLFCELVKIDAPSRQERQMADRVGEILRGLGCAVWEDQAGQGFGGNCGNLYVTLPGELPGLPLLFSAHLDTVVPCLGKQAIIGEDRVIRSAGNTILGADDLTGVTAVIAAIKSLRESHTPHRSIEFMISVGEEIHLEGSPRMDFSRITAREGYTLDTSGAPGFAAVKAPGRVELLFEVFGKAAHAGIAPETGVSAIQAAARGIARMPLGKVDAATTANIGRIEGGGPTNIVTDYCRFTAECRSLKDERLKAQVRDMRGAVEQAAAETGARVEITEKTSYLPYETDPDSPVVRRFTDACRELGLPGTIGSSGGGSDNNVFAQHGIQGIVLSCGMMQVHSCEEYVTIRDLVDMARLVEALMRRL